MTQKGANMSNDIIFFGLFILTIFSFVAGVTVGWSMKNYNVGDLF